MRAVASCQPPATSDKRRDSEKGQALVELALVLPILLLILMAIVDLGRMYHGYLAVTTAAREAARQAALGRTDEEIRTTALLAAAPLETTRLSTVISPAYGLRYSGTSVDIEVHYQLEVLTPGMRAFFPNPYVVVGRAVMKRE